MRFSVFFASLLAVGVLAGMALFERGRDRELQDLRRQVGALASALSREPQQPSPGLTLQVVNPVAPSAPPTPTASAARPEAGVTPSESEAKAQRVNNMESFFVSDPPATDWGGRVEADARRKLQAALPAGSSLQSFDCHETMCRIETSHDSRDDFQKYVRSAFLTRESAVWNAHFYVALDDESSEHPTAVAFIAREGQTFPKFQQ